MEALKEYEYIGNFVTKKTVEVRFEKGRVKSAESEIEDSVIIRVHKGKKFGIIACSPSRFNDSLRNLKKVLKHNVFGEYEIPTPKKARVRTYNRRLLRKIDELVELHPESKFQIPAGHITVEETKFRVCNSNGEEADYKSTSFHFSFDMTNGEDTTFVCYSGNEFVDPQKLVEEAEFWLQKLPKKKYTSDEIILDYDAAAELLEVFLSNFNAYNIYSKLSRFKLGEKVANFDILDDPKIDLGYNSYPFDCEGNEGRKKYLVKDGTFVNALTNIFTAKKLGIPISGNASGLGVSSISPSNIIVECEETEDANGLMINFVLGVHTINIASGDASLGIGNGIVVKDGEAVARVKGMINVNIYEAFKQAKFLGKVKFVDGVKLRRMRIPAVVIS